MNPALALNPFIAAVSKARETAPEEYASSSAPFISCPSPYNAKLPEALPSLNAFINYNYLANAEEFTFLDNNQQWINTSLLGVSLNVPIFSSFGRRAKTAQAKIALETADIRLEETKQRLSLQAKSAKNEYELSIKNYETTKRNVNLAERIEKKQRIKFFEGISTSFDLSQAQNQLYTQQQNYIQSMLQVIAKKAALENALNIPIN